MPTFLPELADLLRGATSLAVRISPPEPDTETVFLWPWRVELVDTLRTNRPPGRLPPTAPPPPIPVQIHLLLVAQQKDRAQAVSTLVAAGRAVDANPVFTGNGSEGRILRNSLSNADLCSVFSSAGLRLQPCLSYVMTVTG